MKFFLKLNFLLFLGCIISLIITYFYNENYINFFAFGLFFYQIIVINIVCLLFYLSSRFFQLDKRVYYLNICVYVAMLVLIGWNIYDITT